MTILFVLIAISVFGYVVSAVDSRSINDVDFGAYLRSEYNMGRDARVRSSVPDLRGM